MKHLIITMLLITNYTYAKTTTSIDTDSKVATALVQGDQAEHIYRAMNNELMAHTELLEERVLKKEYINNFFSLSCNQKQSSFTCLMTVKLDSYPAYGSLNYDSSSVVLNISGAESRNFLQELFNSVDFDFKSANDLFLFQSFDIGHASHLNIYIYTK